MDKRVMIAALAALVMGAAIGCGEKTETPEAPPASTTTTDGETSMNAVPGPVKEPAMNASIVDYTNEKGEVLCPVMKTVILDKSKAVSYQDYEGRRYYFCCDGCPDQFAADPTKYAMVDHGDHQHAAGEDAH